MRMRPIPSAFVGILLGTVALSGFAQIGSPAPPPPAPAASSKPPPAKPSRAPIGAPPAANSDEINSAYEFRNRMSSDPACQELARESDRTYADEKMKAEDKQQSLEQLRRRAAAAGCI